MSGESSRETDIGGGGYTPGVLQKSAEVLDGKRVGKICLFEECGKM